METSGLAPRQEHILITLGLFPGLALENGITDDYLIELAIKMVILMVVTKKINMNTKYIIF